MRASSSSERAGTMAIISEKDCILVLEGALKGKKFDLLDFQLQPFPEVLGFHGSHALLKMKTKIAGKEKEIDFFVKIAAKHQNVFDKYLSRAKFFEKEHIMITKVIEELEASVGRKITAECYLSRLNKVMVLENLRTLGYEVSRNGNRMDIVHAKIAVETFADLHAAALLLEHSGQDIAARFPELSYEAFFRRPDGENPDECVVVSCHRGVSKWAEVHVPDIPSNLRQEAFEKGLERVLHLAKPSKVYKNVVNHGDPWGFNIMYKYDGDKPAEGILVDFQAARYVPPAIDVVQFLYIALSQEFREKHKHELVDAYYSRLGSTLSSKGLDVGSLLPRAEFDESLRLYVEFGRVARLYYSYITRVPMAYLKPAVGDAEVFLDFMIRGDPTIPLSAAEDKAYRDELVGAVEDVVMFYTGYKRTVKK